MFAPRRSIPVLLAVALFGVAGRCVALDPDRGLRQFHHTAWTLENGAPADVWALAQTTDGYLWLGTGAGLYRFDGVRFEKFRPAGDDRAPASNINALLATQGGDLWIGYRTGALSRLRGGRLRNFSPGLADASVNTIVQDLQGRVWAALSGVERGGLARFVDGRWEMIGRPWGLPQGPVFGLTASPDGSIWVTTAHCLLVLRNGASRFEVLDDRIDPGTRIDQAPDGRLWLSRGPHGLHPLDVTSVGGKQTADRSARPLLSTGLNSRRALFDRDGALWATDAKGGIFRVAAAPRVAAGHSPAPSLVEHFSLEDGLSSAVASPLLEDREGDIWVGTNLGLDRFRTANVVAAPGVPLTSLFGFQATVGVDGGLIVATGDSLLGVWPERKAEVLARLPSPPSFLRTDRHGVIWVGLQNGLYRFERRRLVREDLPPDAAGRLLSWVQLPSGAIWVAVGGRGVFERRGSRWRRISPFSDPEQFAPNEMALGPGRTVWIAHGDSIIVRDGPRLRAFSAADGLAVGGVQIIAPGPRETLVGGDFGLARFNGHGFQTLATQRIGVLSRISGIVQTSRGETWLNGVAGVVRVSTRDLDAVFDHPQQSLRYQLFDLRDGLPGVAQQDGGTPTAFESPDGRIWFVTNHGVAWLDPSHLSVNPLPPPVAIRSLTADGEEQDLAHALRLRAGVSNVQIDYTALSLTMPERVRFRYRLDGVDKTWVDPGLRRQAFYTKLGPGSYVFHLIAANNDGVWNRTGADIRFYVPPTFLQSRWFTALCALVGLAILWLLYSIRLRQVAGRIRLRLEARLSERERIARELHDTLLQGVQGLVLSFQAVAETIPPRQSAHRLMQQALDKADGILVEARDRVIDLRSGSQGRALAQTLSMTAEKLSLEPRISFRLIVEGAPRLLHPVVQDEISRLGEEALINVLQHSRAESVEVSVTYHPQELRLHVRDDGVGIGPDVLANGGLGGHFGLLGMRERARRIEGELSISSRPGAGTEIGLTVPARAAYVGNPGSAWGRALRGLRMRSAER